MSATPMPAVSSATPPAPSPTLAMAGLALLVFPKAVKTVAYGALALYAFQLFKLYQSKGGAAVAAAAKSAYSDAQTQLAQIQTQETQIAMSQVAPLLTSGNLSGWTN